MCDSKVDIVVDDDIEGDFSLPDNIASAVQAACTVAGVSAQPMLCIRFASNAEIRQLNSRWRGLDRVTDVLSFPMQDADAIGPSESLGDIALAMPFVHQEADRLGLPPTAHILHLVVHATLHLLGYDHMGDEEAVQMQQLESRAMQLMGLHDPYPALPS